MRSRPLRCRRRRLGGASSCNGFSSHTHTHKQRDRCRACNLLARLPLLPRRRRSEKAVNAAARLFEGSLSGRAVYLCGLALRLLGRQAGCWRDSAHRPIGGGRSRRVAARSPPAKRAASQLDRRTDGHATGRCGRRAETSRAELESGAAASCCCCCRCHCCSARLKFDYLAAAAAWP